MKKDAQTLIEYLLIFVFVAVIAYTIVSHINLNTLKRYVFIRPANSTDTSKIEIEPMTYGD